MVEWSGFENRRRLFPSVGSNPTSSARVYVKERMVNMSDMPSERSVYKMIKNYLANELGVNRAYIDSIIVSHVRDRNIEAVVKQEVDRYIHNKISWTERNPEGIYVSDVVQRRIMNLVDKYVAEYIESGLKEKVMQIADVEIAKILSNVQAETREENK